MVHANVSEKQYVESHVGNHLPGDFNLVRHDDVLIGELLELPGHGVIVVADGNDSDFKLVARQMPHRAKIQASDRVVAKVIGQKADLDFAAVR